jgi:uncharacterized membrane protein YeaQ/YmgE (transglycosylase-associated protein family)
MSIIGWIVMGAIVGWIASMLTSNNARMGIITNIIIGVVGAFLGGWLMSLIGKTGITGFNIQSFLVALLGAVILLIITNALSGRRR